jgi:hypothetical protein
MSRLLTSRISARTLGAVFVLFVAFGTSGFASAAPDRSKSASEVVNNLVNGKYDAIVAKFNSELKGKLSAATIAQVWQSVITQNGAFQEQVGSEERQEGKYTAVTVRVRHEHGVIDVEVDYDTDGLIAGLWIRPADMSRNIKPPTE